MAARMVQTIDLGFGAIKINKTKTSAQLRDLSNKLNKENCAEDVYGLWVYAHMTIYIARDMNTRAQYQTVVHEVAEAIMCYLEIPWKHDKVLLLENMITNLLNNRRLIQGNWRSQDATLY